MSIIHAALSYGLTLPVLQKRLGQKRSWRKSSKSRRMRLTEIIRHANVHCPYYKDKYDSFLESEKYFADEEFYYAFSHLPAIDKLSIAKYNNDFHSDTLIKEQESKEAVSEDISQKPSSLWKLLKRAIFDKDFTTALSLGGFQESVLRRMDHHDTLIYVQSILHALEKNGWKRGQSYVAFMPDNTYFTNDLTKYNKVLNRVFGFTMLPYKDLTIENVDELLLTLKRTKAAMLIISPHALQRVAEIMHINNRPIYESLPYINVSGEFLLDCSKYFIQTMFPNSDIQCSYGASECGMIAHQSALSSHDYDVLDELVYLEQSPDNGLLVTTYQQTAFPLIRYKIEDMGRIINCDHEKQKIKSLEGRKSDHLIGEDGYMYFPSFFNVFINELNKTLNGPIIDFMLRHGYEDSMSYIQFNFVLTGHAKEDKIRKAAMNILKPVFANYDHISIAFPHHIDHNDNTTKYKIIECGDATPQVLGGYYSSVKQSLEKEQKKTTHVKTKSQWYAAHTTEQDTVELQREQNTAPDKKKAS